MPQPDGLAALAAKRAARTSRSAHLPPPKRPQPNGTPVQVEFSSPDHPGVRLMWLPLDQVAPNPENPRDEDMAADPATRELAESMAAVGQLQSAVVIPRDAYLRRHPQHADTVGDRPWVLLVGNRRHAAARAAGWDTLECVTRGDDGDLIDDAPIIENIHRKAIAPLREAAYLTDLVQRHGSQHKVAKHIGKTQPYVQQRLSLLRLIAPFQQLLDDEKIGVKDARLIAVLDPAAQRKVWAAGPPYTVPEEGSSDNPVITREPPTERPPRIDIRMAGRDPGRLAGALRDRLTVEEIAELVRHLTDPAA